MNICLEEFYVFSFLFLVNPREFKVLIAYGNQTETAVVVERLRSFSLGHLKEMSLAVRSG